MRRRAGVNKARDVFLRAGSICYLPRIAVAAPAQMEGILHVMPIMDSHAQW
ncbi:hypothetical protein SDC9_02657 [bioreactor metagenome]|uniref:Uncharacterized protein n=2 Tax=root TaxID=1 RepID=A0A644SR81_9ZZZZ|nr:hypothetical protein [Desulfovibrio desulfuricans]MEA4989637.1 hypothetical protein [Desulfovibrio desulfuricans]